MSLFIDVHDLSAPVSLEEAAKAHAADLQVQPEFGVHYLRYWVGERHGKISGWSTRRTRSPLTPCIAWRTA